jgi:hypothetical protein
VRPRREPKLAFPEEPLFLKPVRIFPNALSATDWRNLCQGAPKLVPRSHPKPPKRHTKIKQQIDLYSLALEVQTLSLVLSDLRDRLVLLENKSHSDKITRADRALLSNLDQAFKKANSSPLVLLSGPKDWK